MKIDNKIMCPLFSELDVEKAIRRYLANNGFDVEERARSHGVDILAHKKGKTYYIEVEGNKKPNGHSFTPSQKYTHLLRVVGQICLRMEDNPKGMFLIGLPEDEYYTSGVKKLKTAMKRLGVTVLFVNNASQVHV